MLKWEDEYEMTLLQFGDLYLLDGSSQGVSIDGITGAMVFIYGSNDTFSDDFSTNVTVSLSGHDDRIDQYGGNIIPMTILGFNSSDSLSVYNLFLGANGVPLPAGSSPTAASLKPDGHGGTDLMLAYGGGSIDFVRTSELTILAAGANIIGSVR